MIFAGFPKLTKDFLLAKAKNKKIALPEGDDERVIKAAQYLTKELGIKCILGEMSRAAGRCELPITCSAEARGATWTLARSASTSDEQRRISMLLEAHGRLLAQGEVDAVIAGCATPTAQVIRAALTTVGMRPGIKKITSAFLFALQNPTPGGEKLVLYSDCAVLPKPGSDELVEIAFLASEAFSLWTGQEPRISFLSFSTDNSAQHPDVQKMRDAADLFAKKYPHLLSEGEVQFDTACVPGVALRKKPAGQIQGKTNVFIFPDLNAGNICYKMTQYLGNSQALGPVLLGCAKPFSDLSRGASVEDIIHVAILTLGLTKE